MDPAEKDYREFWHSTVRNNENLSAEEALIHFHEGIYNGRPIIMEEFILDKFIARKPEENEIFHHQWIDSYELKVLHSAVVNDIAQFVCEITYLDNEHCECIRFDVITLEKE